MRKWLFRRQQAEYINRANAAIPFVSSNEMFFPGSLSTSLVTECFHRFLSGRASEEEKQEDPLSMMEKERSHKVLQTAPFIVLK